MVVLTLRVVLAFAAIGVVGCSPANDDAPKDRTGGQASSTSTAGGATTTGPTSGSGAAAEAGDGGGGAVDAGPVANDAGSVVGPSFDGGARTGCSKYTGGGGAKSAWVSVDANGQLAYKKLPVGDQIMDFSFAGYGGGGVKLPEVPMAATMRPSGGDDTTVIQAAIDSVASKPLANGFRGAVVLEAGTYKVSGTLRLSASGVALRGAGSGTGGTLVQLTGGPHLFMTMGGSGSWRTNGAAVAITDAYVPSGASSFHVGNAADFAVGDTVLVSRPTTSMWIHFMGMDTLVRDGTPQQWLAAGSLIATDRVIRAIDGNLVTLDVPLSDSFDSKYLSPPGPTLWKYTFAGRISGVGLESMQVVGDPTPTPISQPQYELVSINAVIDGWVKNVVAHNCQNTIHLGQTAKRVTLEDVEILHDVIADGSVGYPLDYTIAGTQLLMQRCSSVGANVYSWATAGRVTGPNVVLNSKGSGAHNRFEPHQRWATGLLGDNVTEDDMINFYNRGTAGSGHGWTVGWGVVWNSSAATIDVEQPPGSMNWAIGGKGRMVTQGSAGEVDSVGTPVAPASLYIAQLCARLGPEAVANIGYP